MSAADQIASGWDLLLALTPLLLLWSGFEIIRLYRLQAEVRR